MGYGEENGNYYIFIGYLTLLLIQPAQQLATSTLEVGAGVL